MSSCNKSNGVHEVSSVQGILFLDVVMDDNDDKFYFRKPVALRRGGKLEIPS